MWPIALVPYDSGRSVACTVGAAGQWEFCGLITGLHQRRCVDFQLIHENYNVFLECLFLNKHSKSYSLSTAGILTCMF